MTEAAAPKEGFVTIKINKDEHRGPIRGAVNGRAYEVKTGSDEQVPIYVARSLRDTNIDFTIVAGEIPADERDGEGGAEGSAPSSTVENTAIRAVAPGEGLTPGTSTPSLASELSPDEPVLGQTGGAQGGAEGGGGASSSGGSEGGEDGGDTGGTEGGGEGGDTFKPDDVIAGNVNDVKGRLADLSDEQLAKVRAAEKDREKPRNGVLSAIDELAASRKKS